MDNKSRNIHNSGPLGMLLKSGQINKLDKTVTENEDNMAISAKQPTPNYFKTKAGIEFLEDELIYVDPKECEPWKYANRQENELGDIEKLVESIKTNKQLQPALLRQHSEPHDGIKYEIIFGRRRHIACLKLGIPFLAIKKNISNIQEAIATQDAENKFRKDVSNYSNAFLYKKLLEDNVFNSQKELAEKLKISTSSLNDLMAFTRIPNEIINKIPNIHELSKLFAVAIVTILNESRSNYEKLLKLAPQIGKSITSPMKLKKLLNNKVTHSKQKNQTKKLYTSNSGSKLFTLKYDQRGMPNIVFNKKLENQFNIYELCNIVKSTLEDILIKSGYPNKLK